MADDLSSARGPVLGLDMVAASVGRFARGGTNTATPATVAATGALPAGGVEVSGQGTARLDLITTTAPASYTVTIQTSYDNGVTDSWRTVAAFPSVTAVGTVRQVFTGLDRWVRANVTALTTGPAIFTLSGEIV